MKNINNEFDPIEKENILRGNLGEILKEPYKERIIQEQEFMAYAKQLENIVGSKEIITIRQAFYNKEYQNKN